MPKKALKKVTGHVVWDQIEQRHVIFVGRGSKQKAVAHYKMVRKELREKKLKEFEKMKKLV